MKLIEVGPHNGNLDGKIPFRTLTRLNLGSNRAVMNRDAPQPKYTLVENQIVINRLLFCLQEEIYKEHVHLKIFHKAPFHRSRTMYKLKLLATILFAVFAQRVAADDIPGGEVCSCTPL